MAFLKDVWVVSAFNGTLYKLEDDVVKLEVPTSSLEKSEPNGVHVCQDRITVYTANRASNTVSQFKMGEYVGDIEVGEMPIAICEDTYGAIYVTCYKDSMVYKIEENSSGVASVTAKILVDAGPWGIVCDSDNTVWVACSSASTVARIVGNTKVSPSINMGDETSMPYGITCDKNDNIWVTNYGSNVVSKINRSRKVLDKELGTDKGPQGIVADTDGYIWVANYIGDTVSKINTTTGEIKEIALPHGSGASAIDINQDGDVYVVATLNHEVIKIHKDEIIARIPVGTNIAGFGDFIGTATYNVFAGHSSSSMTVDQAAIKLMANMKLPIKVIMLTELSGSTIIKFTSDMVNLAAFDHFTVNDEPAAKVTDDTYMVTLPSRAEDIKDLEFIGYFDDTANLPVEFNTIPMDQLHNIIVGSLVDDGSGTGAYTFVPSVEVKKLINYGTEIDTLRITPNGDGNMVVLINNRVNANVANGITVDGLPIKSNWEITDPGIQAFADAAVSALYPNHTIYMDPNKSYTGNSSLMVIYRT